MPTSSARSASRARCGSRAVAIAPPKGNEYRATPMDVPLRQQLVEIVRREGYRYYDEPLRLASGKSSHHFVDGKRALSDGESLTIAGLAILELAKELGIGFDAVGGMIMGADHL